MKTLKIRMIALALILSAGAACPSAALAESCIAEKLGLSFDVPAGWSTEGEPKYSGAFDEPMIFIDLDDKEAKERDRVGLYITSKSFEKVDTPKDLTAAAEYFRLFGAGGINETVDSEGAMTFGGYPARQLIVTQKGDDPNKEPMRDMEIAVFNKNRMIVIHFFCVESRFEFYLNRIKVFFDTAKLF